jgi:hypothetical protein
MAPFVSLDQRNTRLFADNVSELSSLCPLRCFSIDVEFDAFFLMRDISSWFGSSSLREN